MVNSDQYSWRDRSIPERRDVENAELWRGWPGATHRVLHGQPEIRAADSSRTTIIGNFKFDYRGKPYKCVGFPWYNRIFSKAHTQIECDDRVWQQAESMIHADLAPENRPLSPPPAI